MAQSRTAITQGLYIEPFAQQRVTALGLEPPPMMWIFEWDILTGDSAVLSVMYQVVRDATGGDIEGPDVRNDGDTVAFAARPSAGVGWSIWTVTLSTGHCTQVVAAQGTIHNFDPAWSPDGAYIVFASTRGKSGPSLSRKRFLPQSDLWRIKVASGQVSDPAAYFDPAAEDEQTFGRLRTVVRDPSGRLWLTTSNTDGRGEIGEGDDRILLIEP